MKRNLLALLAVIPMTMSLSGCIVSVGGDDQHSFSTEFGDREYKNRKIIAGIDLNSPYDQVFRRLGVADFTERYQKNNDTIEILYYRTHRVHKDDLTTKDECTYLYFTNGYLTETGIGKSAMNNN